MYTKITISGKICTGKSSVFRQLQKKLNWPTFSSGAYFREYAKTHDLGLNSAEEQNKKLTMEVDMMVKKKLSEPGNLLLDAWLGGVLAQNAKGVLKVLLVADDKVRYKRFSEREKTTLSQAQTEVTSRDNSWFEKVSKIHKRSDFFDTKNYDMIIDTSHISIATITRTILKKLEKGI